MLEHFDFTKRLTVDQAMELFSAIEKKYPQAMEKLQRLKDNYPIEFGKTAAELLSLTSLRSFSNKEVHLQIRYEKFRSTFGEINYNEVAHWFSWWM